MQKEEKIKRIVEYKRQGKTNKEIGLMEDIKTDEHTVGDYLKKAIEQGQITKDEIEEAMNQEKKILAKRIIEYAKQGLTRREIYRMSGMPKSETTITEYIELGIKLGMASRKQIEEARAKRAEQKEIEMLQQIMDYKARKIKNKAITNIPGMPNSANTITKYVRRAKQLGIKGKEKQPQKLSEFTTREKIEKHNTLMQQIAAEIKENSENPLIKEQIRDYIDLCNEIYQEKEISIPELKFLKSIMHRIPIEVKDIVWYVKKAWQIEAYKEALEMVRARNKMKIKILKKEEKSFQELETVLLRANKINKASQMIKEGKTNSIELIEATGLTKDEINILKIKLSKQPVLLLNIAKREKILQLLNEQESSDLQIQYGISDFEMEDIKSQAKYRKSKNNDKETLVKQDSKIRLEVLCMKLGIKEDTIEKKLKLTNGKLEEDKKLAIQYGLIQPEEVNGIKLLNKKMPKFKEIDK